MNKNMNNHHSPTIYTEETMKMLESVLVLDDEQLYIYVMLNAPQGDIKIGQTRNIAQRLQSLSGSNGAGNRIVALYCSPSTYVLSMENACHSHYNFARISGTEWFDGSKVNFEEVVQFIDGLFYTDSYKRCNELRKRNIEEKRKDDDK